LHKQNQLHFKIFIEHQLKQQKGKKLKAMMALSNFLVLLAIFLLAGYANAFQSLSQVAGDQI
jgi:hypothetical protein